MDWSVSERSKLSVIESIEERKENICKGYSRSDSRIKWVWWAD